MNCFKETNGTPADDGPLTARCQRGSLSDAPGNTSDFRGLQPPEPLLRILEVLEAGGDGPHEFLLVREPLPLYPLLDVGGWRHSVRRDERGVVLTVFRGARGT